MVSRPRTRADDAGSARTPRSGASARLAGVAAGLVADGLMGEPPVSWHPVARFGAAMEWADRRWWRDSRATGVVYAASGIGTGVASGALLGRVLSPFGSTAGAVALAAGGRSLRKAATDVAAALDQDDLEGAREGLRALVGRQTGHLDAHEVARAVVESVAENTTDAVVATAWWGALGGAPGALGHRAGNTLDAMVGYRNERYQRFGWAAARADDVGAWPAARLTAVLVALVRPTRIPAIWRAVRDGAGRHPSPNAGVSEAAVAGALGLRLGGANRYGDEVEVRPSLGHGRAPDPRDIARVIRLQRDVTLALAALAASGAWCLARAGRGGSGR